MVTDTPLDAVNATGRARDTVPYDGDTGACTVSSRYTTAAVLINESGPRLRNDLESLLVGPRP